MILRTLTARELEVAHLIADGFTNIEIAEKLLISPRTVKAYSDTIRYKLDVEKRRHIGARIRELGI